jgi:hypothetical protein
MSELKIQPKLVSFSVIREDFEEEKEVSPKLPERQLSQKIIL